MKNSLLSDTDLYLFNEGTHTRLFERLGAHRVRGEGTCFAVWAPNAKMVSVTGDFNGWNPEAHRLTPRGRSGIWEGFVEGVGPGALYKYHIVSRFAGYTVDKADPFGFLHQVPPRTASVVWDLAYDWTDAAWLATRSERNAASSPMSIYEVHPGSWMREREQGNRSLDYRTLGERLGDHILDLGFTHVELLPVMEHPFFGSWGYQVTGYFAPTGRYGSPQDLMAFIDAMHARGIGVILDWVPSHFPSDGHGLAYFDGTHLYEHADPRQGFHPDWKSFIFNYGRAEVRSFLLSSALFWLETYHADALRVDGVASMLYLDYSRREGEWIPNRYGGRENLDAIGFLKQLNTEVYGSVTGAQTIAEESTAWPLVSRPIYVGGLGFGMKWDMGWMHDTLKYFERDPIHRGWHHNQMTFRGLYAFTENFVLPLSHDEVVHGKGSLLAKMPGDEWQKFANLRALYGVMYMQPGKKLLFMGGEFGQWREWNHDDQLDWGLLEKPLHAGLQRWVTDLNRIYRSEPAAHQLDFQPQGFEWVDADDNRHSVLTWLRIAPGRASFLLVACNLTPVLRTGYRVGVPEAGTWTEILNSDSESYGGSGAGNYGSVDATRTPWHGRPFSIELTLPPLSVTVFRGTGSPAEARPAREEARARVRAPWKRPVLHEGVPSVPGAAADRDADEPDEMDQPPPTRPGRRTRKKSGRSTKK
ncbi:MAG: 1,4-alpha-glucan branching protein GlgB [Longimicrobiales bacterium]